MLKVRFVCFFVCWFCVCFVLSWRTLKHMFICCVLCSLCVCVSFYVSCIRVPASFCGCGMFSCVFACRFLLIFTCFVCVLLCSWFEESVGLLSADLVHSADHRVAVAAFAPVKRCTCFESSLDTHIHSHARTHTYTHTHTHPHISIHVCVLAAVRHEYESLLVYSASSW